MTKVYVVGQEGFDYNDEVYYKSEAGGAHPIKAYSTKKAAQKVVDEKNIKFFKELSLDGYNGGFGDYAYDVDDLFDNYNELVREFGDVFGSIDEISAWVRTDFDSLMLEKQLEIVNGFNPSPYIINEVELED